MRLLNETQNHENKRLPPKIKPIIRQAGIGGKYTYFWDSKQVTDIL